MCACNPEQLTNHTCFVCDKKKKKKIPGTISIGKYRKLHFCKKSELSNLRIHKTVEVAINEQIDLIRECDISLIGYDTDNSENNTDKEKDHLDLCM
jgi:hypothetical protein